MHERDRERHVAGSAEGRAVESAVIMTDDARLEAESKGRWTANSVKTGAERLRDVYPRR
jgi:hypothetical protein